ncbi:hypothetical protein IQ24_02612 [Paracoccus sulfuroxidans]|uniref:Portal protein n=2 Tax=Paracoccus sulfuroxidans TaxID=384678 RepID=A0A562NKJ1_9RHOB|nr:hypothetical protein IQ24_02612 [Paracoccus sulfuroxidans]
MTDDDIQKIVANAIEAAVDFITSDIEPDRQLAQRYFNGEVDIGHEPGRSKVVATKCRDAVRQVKPSLMRVFMTSAKPVEYVPTGPEDVAVAEQQTKYAQYCFTKAGGYKLLNSAFHDAMVKKTGILKGWWDETETVEIDSYSQLTDEAFALVAGDDEVEVLEHTPSVQMVDLPMGPQPITLHDAKVARTNTKGELAIKAIAPEDFFVDSNATCLEDAYICGHRAEKRVGDLVAMGFDFDEVFDLGQGDDDDEAESNRRGFTPDDEEGSADPSMKPVTVYEAYMRVDIEGAGIPRLYSFILAGGKKKLLHYELADMVPFAVFEIDPEPHAFFGRSLVDILIEDQDAGTAMLRGLLDNVAASNAPRLAIDTSSGAVNVEDVLNNEIGAVIRTKGTPMDKIMPVVVPFTGDAAMGALQYFDGVIEGKTGVSRASLGLDADALQSTTAAAVNATVSGAEGQVEVMARNLAEGGMKQLFRLILQIVSQHVGPGEMMRLDGQFVSVDPRSWRLGMDMQANVGLGSDRAEQRVATLQFTLMQQMQMMGMGSPLVTLTNIRNTLADIQAAGGVHNADRYFQPMNPQVEQQLQQQAAEAQQGAPQDPNAILAQAEVQKAQISAQAKQQGDVIRAQTDLQKAQMADDLRRDEMEQKAIIDAAKIYGEFAYKANAADAESIRAMQAEPRNY